MVTCLEKESTSLTSFSICTISGCGSVEVPAGGPSSVKRSEPANADSNKCAACLKPAGSPARGGPASAARPSAVALAQNWHTIW